MELVFLGTGAGTPSKERHLSSIALNFQSYRGVVWLFDCGEAAQYQLMYTSIKLSKLERIFITHLHGDHIFGLPGLLGTRSMQGVTERLTIYGPRGIKEFVESALRLSCSYLTYPLEIIEIQKRIVYQDDRLKVIAESLYHGIESFGFRVEEAPRTGALDAQRLADIGIKTGYILQRLKRGETVQLEDGRTLYGKDYLGPERPGRVVVICGDTVPTEATTILAQGADVLVHEATLEDALAVQANSRGHSTTRQAARLAKAARVRQLVITHISPRYTETDRSRLLAECREIFTNTEMAMDFSSFKI